MTFYTFTAAVVLTLLLTCTSDGSAEVIVMDRLLNKTLDVIADMPSTFGPQLSLLGLKGVLVKSRPVDACGQPIAGPPALPPFVTPAYSHWFVLIERGNCTFYEKVLQAQLANYSAAIVMNIGSDFIEPMSADDGDNITIPSVFIGQTDGEALSILFRDYNRTGVILSGDLPNIESYLLPFAITVAVCFVGMLLCMVVKCVRDYRRSMRHRLSWRALRRLPLHKFRVGEDAYDTCAICLDDYVEGDKLRVLPCNHAYHSRCIDPWLTKRRRVCPVCKQKVRAPGERLDTSDEEDIDADSERAPLLQQATQVSAGTFGSSRENPFVRAGRRAHQARRPHRPSYDRLSDGDGADAAPDGERRGSADSTAPSDTAPSDTAPADTAPADTAPAYTAPDADAGGALLPQEGEALEAELRVVSVTRPAKKKKKKTRRPREAQEEEEEEEEEGRAAAEGQGERPAPPSSGDGNNEALAVPPAGALPV